MSEPETRTEILEALLNGTMALTDFEISAQHSEDMLEVKYETDEASVYIQLDPYAVQAYDQPRADGDLIDMGWDELTNDYELYRMSDDYVAGFLHAIEQLS